MDISTYRKKTGLTQADFAALLRQRGESATQSLICQWESGKVRIPAERVATVEAITEGLVTRHDLRPDIFGAPSKRNRAA